MLPSTPLGHWDEVGRFGRERLPIALVNEGNPVDIIADWISERQGYEYSYPCLPCLHIKLLLSLTLPPINEAEDEIILGKLLLFPGRVDFVNELVKRVNSEAE